MNILALGAAGFIGSHLTERLLRAGHRVVAVDLYDDKIADFGHHENLTFLRQDIREPGWDMERLVRETDLVVDLVAYANPGLYVKIPLEVFRLNFTENLKIAELCVKHAKRLVQFSTCEVYGRTVSSIPTANVRDPHDPAHATFSEDTSELIMGPVNKHRWIYACAKQMLERVLHAYGIEQGFNYSIIRPFNFIGPKIDFLASEQDGIPRVFSWFSDALLHGTPMKLVDGGYRQRCYTYIDDAVECCCRIIENPGGVCDRQIFNIGSPNNETTIRGLAELMRELYRQKYLAPGERLSDIVEVTADEFYGDGYEDSDRRIPDITKARTLLGWEPQWTLEKLVAASLDYQVADWRSRHAGETQPVAV